jgi:hypothetical protein
MQQPDSANQTLADAARGRRLAGMLKVIAAIRE